MLECSGAASAVNADVLCCKDDISEGILFLLFFFKLFILFLYISLSVFMFVLEHETESIVTFVHV